MEKTEISEHDIFLFLKLHKRRQEVIKAFLKGAKLLFNSAKKQSIDYKTILKPLKSMITKDFPIMTQDCFNLYYRIDPVISQYTRKTSTDKKTHNVELYSKTQEFLQKNQAKYLNFKEHKSLFWYICLLFLENVFEQNADTRLLAQNIKKKTEEFSQNFHFGEDQEKLFIGFFSSIVQFFNLIEVYEIEIFELLKINNMNEKNV